MQSQGIQYGPDQRSGKANILVFVLLMLVVPAILYYAAMSLLFPHGTCKTGIGWSHKGEFWDMMDYIKKYDPSAHDLICNDVEDVEIKKLSGKAGQFEVNGLLAKELKTKISIDKEFWSRYDKAPFAERASVLVHEICHATMFKIRGNLMNLGGCDLEYPCYLRDALLKYRLGYYNNTKDPYKSMLDDRKVCGTKIAGPNNYCKRASIEVTGISGQGIVIKNNGTENIHCMMLELSIDSVLHPVGCGYLPPGQTTTIINEYFEAGSVSTLRIFGCDDKIQLIPQKP